MGPGSEAVLAEFPAVPPSENPDRDSTPPEVAPVGILIERVVVRILTALAIHLPGVSHHTRRSSTTVWDHFPVDIVSEKPTNRVKR